MSNFQIIQPGGRPEGSDQPAIKSAKQAAPASKGLRTAISLLLAGLPLLAMPSLTAAAPARSAAKDVGGFPTWYQDNNGVRIGLCYDPNDVNCVAPISPTYDPTKPLAFPTNYPNELFYSATDSKLVIVDDSASCPTFIPPVPAANPGSRVHMALEGAFLNGTLTPGDQMAFGRLRIISTAGNGLCPGAWYTFRTPYGPITVQTDANAEIQGAGAAAPGATTDVGCLPGPISPCNFDLALGAPVLGVGLLHQVNIAAQGYLGSGTAAVPVPALNFDVITGGLNGFNHFDIVKWPANVTPARSGVGIDCKDAACTLLGSTNQFSVAAKLAGPIEAVSSVDFGGQLTGSTSAAKTIGLRNLGSGPLGLDPSTISSITINGVNAADYAITANDCPATALARDAGCNVAITYSPSATGASIASLDITVAGSSVVNHVALNGTGTSTGQAPAASYTPAGANIDFGAVRLTTAGKLQTVTVSNTGTAPLSAIASLVGSNAYSVAYDNCSSAYIPAGTSCDIGLNFIPSTATPVTARLEVATNTGSNFFWDLSGHGTGGFAAVSPTTDAVNTFPDWYQDETGLRVGQCDNPANTLCIAAPVAGAISFPTNYPNEWFYFHSQSTPMNISDPTCQANPGSIFVEAGMEGAFLGTVAPNQGITFGRLRIISHGGLCPNTEYQLTHPYGQSIIATNALGQIKPQAGTTDVGCLGAPCDYTIALSAPVFEGFLKQTVRPDGYLGNPLAPSTITGAPYIDSTGNPANYFKVERLDNAGTGQEIGFTTEFAVSGRLVGPMIASPVATEFGGAEVGLASAAISRTITFTNDGPFNVTLAAPAVLTLEGVQASDYSITSTTCSAGQVLAHAQNCSVTVKFFPNATGDRNASLRLHHSGGNDPLGVPLHGIGNSPAGLAAMSANLTTVKFTDLHVGLNSESAILTISNVGGSSALTVGDPTITAQQPFVINGNTCTGQFIQPGTVCTISLQFQPRTVNNFNATLTIPSNAKTSPTGQTITLSIPLSGKSSNVTPQTSASINTAGMPSWYQDGNGVRLEPCLAQDGNCVLLADPFFDPTLPISWPNNFPSESFYSLIDSELLATAADTSCGGVGGKPAQLRIATEASFTPVNPGIPTPPALSTLGTFNRIRVVADGLCPNVKYDFVTPYNTYSLIADATGAITAKAGTVDSTNVVGSAPLMPGVTQWNPNDGQTAPTGYLGNAVTLHTIVGSQYHEVLPATPPLAAVTAIEPANYFKIIRSSTGKVIAETKLFTVSGRIAGPIVSSLDGKDFLTVEMGRTSTTQSFVISNIGNTPVSSFSTALTGANAGLFTITSNTCTAATLNIDQTCTIQAQFRPTLAAGIGAKSATLSIGHNGLRSPLNILLKGNAIAVQTPALAITANNVTVNAVGTTPSLGFGLVTSGTTSLAQSVTITNSGSGDLKLGTLTIAGTNPTQYAISSTTCPNGPAATALRAGSSCNVSVVFKPTSIGTKPATIIVTATDAVTASGHVAVTIPSLNVALTGTGTAPIITLGAVTPFKTGVAGTPNTTKVTITNSGTANLTVTNASSNKANWSMSFTGCTGVLPTKSCTGTISWTTPSTIAVGATDSATLTINSNASNSPLPTITVSGTRSR